MSPFTTAISPLRSLLGAALLAATSGFAAPSTASPPVSLGDWSKAGMLSSLQLAHATVEPAAGGLEIRFATGQGGRVTFTPALPAAVWKSAAALGLEVENTGAKDAKLTVRVGALTASRNLQAQETLKLALPLGNFAKIPGMKVSPPFPGWGRLEGVKGQLDAKRAPVISFALEGAEPGLLCVRQTVLLPPVETAGMVDAFGQYTRKDWPGKVAQESDLRAKDPALPIENAPPLDRYGGWIGGPKFSASGWFRAEKADGRWWLVTPEGHAYYSIGVDAVVPRSETAVAGREKMFAALPPGAGATADFYQANLARKFGTDWANAWRQETLARLPLWGFNTLGAWSDEALYAPALPAASKPLAYTVILHVDGDFHRVTLVGGAKKMMPDPFDPRLPAAIGAWMKEHGSPYREDPWLLGYFVSNELPLGAWKGPGRYAVVLGALAEAASPAKSALGQQLRTLFPKLEDVATRWKTPLSSWEEFMSNPFLAPKKWTPEFEQDLQKLSAFFAARYYQTVREALRASDPHHLYLGSRFASATPEFIAAAARYCDVTSFNIYRPRLLPGDPVLKLFTALDRPGLVSEFHFGASDRGLFATGLAWAPNQAGRGEAYRDYLASAAAIPAFVGCHWFQYVDQPVTGRASDGENFAIGLVTITDSPYTDLLKMAAHANHTIYQARPTPTAQPLKKGIHGK